MDRLGTDLTKVAGAYATFAGVLAGFVFAVMGYLLSNRSSGNDQERATNVEIALSWSVLAFVSLSVASFLFALLSGEDRFSLSASGTGPEVTRMRPLVLSIVASWVLSIAILVLLLGLSWLFNSEKVSRSLMWQLRVVEWVIGLLTLFYVYGSFLTVPIAQGKITEANNWQTGQLVVIWVLAVTLGEGAGCSLHGRRWKRKQIVRITTQILFLLAVLVCAFIFNIVDFANEAGSGTWHVLKYQWLGLGALGTVLWLCILNLPGVCNGVSSKQKTVAEGKSNDEARGA